MRLKVVVPHRKERGHSNGRYHDWRSRNHPTRRSERRRTLSSEELGDEIRLLPGRQSHRHPVFDHCALDWIGGSGVVVADTAAIGLPEHLIRHRPRRLPAIHHRARHDHGDLSAHRAVPGGLRELPDPADGGRPGHGFSLREHGELLGLSARGAGPGGELLHAGRSHGFRLDLVPAPSHPLRHSGAGLGHHSDARLPDPVHHRLHHGRIELCGDGVAGAHAGDDADAHAPDGMGDFDGHRPRVAGLPRLVRRLRDDAVRQDPGDQLFHAGRCRDGRTLEIPRRQSATCFSTCSGSSAIPRSTSSPCRPSALSPT